MLRRYSSVRLKRMDSSNPSGPRRAAGTPGMKSCGVCALGYRAFRGSDRFTATDAFRKREPVHLRSAITGKIGAPVTIRQPQCDAEEVFPRSGHGSPLPAGGYRVAYEAVRRSKSQARTGMNHGCHHAGGRCPVTGITGQSLPVFMASVMMDFLRSDLHMTHQSRSSRSGDSFYRPFRTA